MRSDLLTSINTERNVRNMIVLTHDIDLILVELVLLPTLKRCGDPMLTIFADAQCAAESYAANALLLHNLGIRYRVVPVSMQPGFRFHPKAVFLSGETNASLFVGSGNLTFGGWRENGEMWVRYDSNSDGMEVISAFRRYLDDVLELLLFPEPVRRDVNEAFSRDEHVWATLIDSPSGLIAHIGKGEALIDRMRKIVGEDHATKITICSPYFDRDGDTLRALSEAFKSRSTALYLPRRQSNLTPSAYATLRDKVEIYPVTFPGRDFEGKEHESFVHAKFYGIEHSGEVTVFIGSANCSRAALMLPGNAGNAELMTHQRMSLSEFSEQFLSDFTVHPGEPILREDDPTIPEIQEQTLACLHVHAAHYEKGRVRVVYSSSAGVTITRCIIAGDETNSSIEHGGDGTIIMRCSKIPRRLMLEGECDGECIQSNFAWVDYEIKLRTSVAERSMRAMLQDRMRDEEWLFSDWTEIMEMLFSHLKRPSVESRPLLPPSKEECIERKWETFTQEDVFTSIYKFPLPSHGRADRPAIDQVGSLRMLLCRWFGIAIPERGDETGTSVIEADVDGAINAEAAGVNRTEKLVIGSVQTKTEAITDRDKRRAGKLVGQLASIMSSSEYLLTREPGLLANDIKLASVLLRFVLMKGWIVEKDFFDCTLRIWTGLFFTSELETTKGWIEYRYSLDDSPEDFREQMVSADLSAALAAWVMSVPSDVHSPDHAMFLLACSLSIAKLPWLWHGGSNGDIATELAAYLTAMSGQMDTGQLLWQEIEYKWLKMIRRGHALQRMEMVLGQFRLGDLSTGIQQDEVSAGELLWQGIKNGFCIVTESYYRKRNHKAKVLRLQNSPGKSEFEGKFTVPLRALLSESILPLTDLFGEAQHCEIREFIDELGADFLVARKPAIGIDATIQRFKQGEETKSC